MIQVNAQLTAPGTRQRELRTRLITLDTRAPQGDWPQPVAWSNAVEWLLAA